MFKTRLYDKISYAIRQVYFFYSNIKQPYNIIALLSFSAILKQLRTILRCQVLKNYKIPLLHFTYFTEWAATPKIKQKSKKKYHYLQSKNKLFRNLRILALNIFSNLFESCIIVVGCHIAMKRRFRQVPLFVDPIFFRWGQHGILRKKTNNLE